MAATTTSSIAAIRQATRKAIEHVEALGVGVRRGSPRYQNLRQWIEQPRRLMRMAKTIIKDRNKTNLKTVDHHEQRQIPDLSDDHELRVMLTRTHHWFDPQVRRILHGLDRKAATGELLVDDLEAAAVLIGAIKHALPADWRSA